MNRDPYHNFASKYDIYIEPFNSVVRQIAMNMHPPKKGMLVLDVGCGTGTNLSLYQKVDCNVFGIDLSPSMLEVARIKLSTRANLLLGNASEMPYPNNVFDMIIAFLTLHEIPGNIRPEVMEEMVRILKHDGRIMLIDYHHGPIRFPKGWWYKTIILIFEIMAGSEHFKNYRDFLRKHGIQGLIDPQKLNIEKKKIVSKGNLALFLLNMKQE